MIGSAIFSEASEREERAAGIRVRAGPGADKVAGGACDHVKAVVEAPRYISSSLSSCMGMCKLAGRARQYRGGEGAFCFAQAASEQYKMHVEPCDHVEARI